MDLRDLLACSVDLDDAFGRAGGEGRSQVLC